MKSYNNVLIIYNPNAMKGKIDEHLPYIKQRLLLRFSEVDAMSSPYEDGAEQLAFKYAAKYDVVVSCGGDGTLRQVINGVVKSGANSVVAVLPYGTCNDVARTLHIPFKLDKAIDTILKLKTTKYDLIFDKEDYTIYSLATGYMASTSYQATSKAKKRLGRMAYAFYALKSLFKCKAKPFTVTYDGKRVHDKFIYFMLINGESAGGFKLNKGDNISNGKCKLVLIKKGKFLAGWLCFVKMFLFGIKSIAKSKNTIVEDISSLEIENHSNIPFAADGEKIKFLKKQWKVSTPITLIKK